MKHVWRKDEKDIYIPGKKPVKILVPNFKFITVKGVGDPNNNPVYSKNIEILYSLSYAIRMMPKSGFTPPDYFEYTVYPLEGYWGIRGDSDYKKTGNKDDFAYEIMIRQPDFVTEDIFEKAMENTLKKKKLSETDLAGANFKTIKGGPAVQIMHIGSFDSEPESFAKIDAFLKENELNRASLNHREIYLSDFNKTAADKLKTVLRVEIE